MKTTPPTPHPRTRALRGTSGLAIALLTLGLVFPADARDPFAVADNDNRVRGNRQAPLTLLEYSDFTCGFCEKFFLETWPALFAEYVQPGTLRLVYRDFPRSSGGPSVDTAQAARCAGEQGRYWAMHDHLFSIREKFSPAQLRQQADTLSLDTHSFDACLERAEHTRDIFADRMEANGLGFRGTPGFVLYVTDDPQNAVAIPGAFPYDTFKEEIDKMLADGADADDADAAHPPHPADPVSDSPVSGPQPARPRT